MLGLIRPILDQPFFYESYHKLIGPAYRSRVLVEEYIRPRPGDRILDIGCGPGNMLPYLPECRYTGFDVNQSYITSARPSVASLNSRAKVLRQAQPLYTECRSILNFRPKQRNRV